MNDERPDAALVAAYLGGDHHALAAIYDRHADALYDTAAAMLGNRDDAADVTQDVFVTAAQRLGQLRDGSRLKPWLFAILRNGVYRRTATRRRARPTDFNAPEVAEVAASRAPAVDAAAVEATELAAEIRAAAAGLEPRDQLVLELVARQRLGGDDLAGALGVSLQQSYVLINRMRDRVERSLGALAVARAGQRDCADLATLLAGWDGRFDVQVRKRVARHVERCAVCATTQRRVGALALVAAAPTLAAPASLRDAVLTATTGASAGGAGSDAGWEVDDNGFPRSHQLATRRSALLRRVAFVSAAAIVALAVGAAVLSNRGDDITSSRAPLPASAMSAPGVETTDVTASVSSAPETTAAAVGDPATTSSSAATTTTTTTADPVTTTTGPRPPASGPAVLVAATTSTTTGPADTAAPVVELASVPSTLRCPWSAAPFVTADVVDESAVDSVILSWSGPGEAGENPMVRSTSSSWSARLEVAQVDGAWTLVVSAEDAAGNVGTASGTTVVTGC